MKKELMSLFEMQRTPKELKINDCFKLVAVYLDENGRDTASSNNLPVETELNLVYTLNHDDFLNTSREIKSRDYNSLCEEISSKMEEILDFQKEELIKIFELSNLNYLLQGHGGKK